MALITCTECGKEVSDQANSCPQCGAKKFKPKPAKKPTSMLTWAIAAIVLIAIAMSAKNSPSSASAPGTVAKTPEQIAAKEKRDAQLQLAAMGALSLKKGMKDPEAFSMTSAVVKNSGAACYEYRAKNGFGATFPSIAIMTSKGKMLVKEHDGNTFSNAWNKECTVSGGDDIADMIKRLGIL